MNQIFQSHFNLDIMKGYSVWFSANGERLAFVTFNDTAVPEVRLPIYSEPDSFQLYTEQVLLRYPTVSYYGYNYRLAHQTAKNHSRDSIECQHHSNKIGCSQQPIFITKTVKLRVEATNV